MPQFTRIDESLKLYDNYYDNNGKYNSDFISLSMGKGEKTSKGA